MSGEKRSVEEMRARALKPRPTSLAGKPDRLRRVFGALLQGVAWRCTRCGGSTEANSRPGATRLEIFFGHVIGGEGLESAHRVAHRGTETDVESSRYRVNDRFGKTGKRDLLQIIESISSEEIRHDLACMTAEAHAYLRFLLDLNEGSDDGLLQCNVNAYRAANRMSWHRDDVDILGKDERPLLLTFHPAAVTVLLQGSRLSSLQVGGFRVSEPQPRKDGTGWVIDHRKP
jgi:hypothetical protein